MHGKDYVGVGMWPAQIEAEDGVLRGFGHDEIWKACKVRDDLFLEHIMQNIDDTPKKLKCIDIGGGRGGLSRNTALGLKAIDRLDHMSCLNIAPAENEINAVRMKEQGLTDKEYSIELADFESLDKKETESLDVVLSSDALMYAIDRDAIMDNMARILAPGGLMVFSDYLMGPNGTQELQQEMCDRMQNNSFARFEHYRDRLIMPHNKLQEIHSSQSPEHLIRHYGYVHYCAAFLKNKKLLADGCSPEFLEL